MSNQITNTFKTIADRWTMLSLTQQVMVGTLTISLIAGTFYMFQRANDDYTVLYSNINPVDAAAAVAKLKESGKPYRVADNGTTILVPANMKNELVLETAGELQSEGTVSLGKIPPVVSGDLQKEWIRKVNTQSIEDILKSIHGIKSAQVIVAEPEHNVFSDLQEPVKASVMLNVEPGYRMQADQAKTIKNLVSHAVPGLQIGNVALSDSNGNPLEGPGGLVSVNGQTEADLRQKNFEDKISKKVLAILTPVVGKGNAVVSVSAQLNFDQAEAQISRVIPSGGSADSPTGLTVSQQVETEHYTGGGKKTEGGPAGVESNIPSYTGTTEKDKDSLYKREIKTTNYESSHETKKVIYAPGNTERLTVSVAINKVLTAKETDEIRDLVENAAGLDTARGDSVAIQGYQFAEALIDPDKLLADASKDAQQKAFVLQVASLVAVVLLGLAALFIFYNLFKKPAEGEIVEQVEEYGYFDEPERLLEEAAIPMIEAKLDPEIEHMRESINNMVETDPGEAARVLVTYMKDM